MSEAVDWQQTQRIAELGAGDGVLTRHLLHSMRADATLAAYEINPQLAHKLNAFNVLRLTVHTDSAETLGTGYDAIFSGLPLLSLPQALRERILTQISRALTPGGVFVQFQYTSLSEPLLSQHFYWTRTRVMRNLPPAYVYRCQAAAHH
jgi:phospholipid N-methyltransferase